MAHSPLQGLSVTIAMSYGVNATMIGMGIVCLIMRVYFIVDGNGDPA
jgi:hypothetical protein